MSTYRSERNRDARLLRKAAELMDKRMTTRSCWAVAMACGAPLYQLVPLAYRYADAMLDGCTTTTEHAWPGGGDAEEDDDLRVLLLCFAAALAETGDLASANSERRSSLEHSEVNSAWTT